MKADNLYPFVGRARELEKLTGYLQLALEGQGRVCFVSGEAGAGKTALVAEFARQAQQFSEDLVIGIGECNAQTGVVDPYLPFREMLRLLTGDSAADQTHPAATGENATRLRRFFRISGEALVESGPDLVGMFIPGGAILARLGAKLVESTPAAARLQALLTRKAETVAMPGVESLRQDQVFEQYTNVLRGMAEACPLMLVLDDLHWADEASLSLLFHLGRRIESSRILVVGSFRPNDIALGRRGERHPLVPVLNELQRHYGEVEVALDRENPDEQRQLVNALLDVQPNRLDGDFREALWQRTQGHPLFVVELLNHLQATGGLVRGEDGHWRSLPGIRWDDLPARVEGIIAERIGRLPEDLRQLLTVASVEGEQFTAEVVARVRHLDERTVVQQLSSVLERQHDLVSAQGVQRCAGYRLSSYRFRHNLFQEYLYDALHEAERSYFHEDIGAALEALHGDAADQIAVRLAHHFEAAGDIARTLPYRVRAAQQAQQQFANAEAILHFQHALQLCDRQDAEALHVESLRDMRPAILEGLGDVLVLTGRPDDGRNAYAAVLATQASEDLFIAARIHRKIGDAWSAQHAIEEALDTYEVAVDLLGGDRGSPPPEQAAEWLQVQIQRMWCFYLQHADLTELAGRVRPVLEKHGSAAQRARYCQYFAMGRLQADRYVVSDETMALARAGEAASKASGQLGAVAASHYLLGACHLDRWDGDGAESHFLESRRLAMHIGAVPQLLPALSWLAVAYRLQQQVADARVTAHEALALAKELDNPTYYSLASLTLAWVAWREDRPEEARRTAQQILSRTVPDFPFRWLGEWVLIATALHDGHFEQAWEPARRMLDARQQRMPEALEKALVRAVHLWDGGDAEAALEALQALVAVAGAKGLA